MSMGGLGVVSVGDPDMQAPFQKLGGCAVLQEGRDDLGGATGKSSARVGIGEIVSGGSLVGEGVEELWIGVGAGDVAGCGGLVVIVAGALVGYGGEVLFCKRWREDRDRIWSGNGRGCMAGIGMGGVASVYGCRGDYRAG